MAGYSASYRCLSPVLKRSALARPSRRHDVELVWCDKGCLCPGLCCGRHKGEAIHDHARAHRSAPRPLGPIRWLSPRSIAKQPLRAPPQRADGVDILEDRAHLRRVSAGRVRRARRAYNPDGVTADGHSIIYIADMGNNTVRAVNLRVGTISTVAGNGRGGDGDPAIQARLNSPGGLAVDRHATLYIAEIGDDRVRAVDLHTGIIRTVTGDGRRGDREDGDPAVRAELGSPAGLAVGGRGILYIADFYNNGVRAVDLRTDIIPSLQANPDRLSGRFTRQYHIAIDTVHCYLALGTEA